MRKIIAVAGLFFVLMAGLAHAEKPKVYVGRILSVKTEVYGAGHFTTRVLFGLRDTKLQTALFDIALRNSDIAVPGKPWSNAQDREWVDQAKGLWDKGMIWVAGRYGYTVMMRGKYIGDMTATARAVPRVTFAGVFDDVKRNSKPMPTPQPEPPKKYTYHVYEAKAQGHFKKEWPESGEVEEPTDLGWYRKENYTVNFGAITNENGYRFKMHSGEDFGKDTKYAYHSSWDEIDDIVTLPVYIPKREMIEDTLNQKYRRFRIEAHDIDSFTGLHTLFTWKSPRWRSNGPMLAKVLGTKDGRILKLVEKEFGQFTEFVNGRREDKAVELLVPQGESVSFRIVKQGYYYLNGTFKVMEDMEKVALLSKVGQKVRKDQGQGSRFE